MLQRLPPQLPSILLVAVSLITIIFSSFRGGLEVGGGEDHGVQEVEGALQRYLMEETGYLLADPALAENSTGIPDLLKTLSGRLQEGALGRTFTAGDIRFRLENITVIALPLFSEFSTPGAGRYTLHWGDDGIPAIHPATGTPVPRGVTLLVNYTATLQVAERGESLQGTLMMDIHTPCITAIAEFYAMGEVGEVTLEGYLGNMLNALVRTRAVLGVGTRSGDSIYELLSPLDIELSLNLALLLYESEAFGSPGEGAVSALDRYFFNTSVGFSTDAEVNPTGFRSWSHQEKLQYGDYLRRRVTLPDATKRRIEELLVTAREMGHLSPAELLLMYLVYDRALEGEGVEVDPYDGKSVLSGKGMANPRDLYSPLDPANPLWMSSLAPQDYWENLTGHHYTPGGAPRPAPLNVGRSPEYLVMGRDFDVEGLYTPRGWYTNVDLQRNASELINYNNTPTRGGEVCGEETRCGGVPLPPTPPDHDFRIKWELTISGEISYTLSIPGGPEIAERQMPFSLNITVFCWYPERPAFPAEEITFRNINTGGAVQTQNYSMWLITPVANATEYYLKYIWQDLRDIFGWGYFLGTLLRASSADGSADPGELLELFAVSMEMERAGREKELSGTYASIKHFMNRYVAGEGLHLSDLGYIEEDSFNMTLLYHPDTDLFTVTATLGGVKVRLELYRVLSSSAGEAFMEVSSAGSGGGGEGASGYSIRLPLKGTAPETPGITLKGSTTLRADPQIVEVLEKEKLPGWFEWSSLQENHSSEPEGAAVLNGSTLCWLRSLFVMEEGPAAPGVSEEAARHFLEVNSPHPSLPPSFSYSARQSWRVKVLLPLWYILDPDTMESLLAAPGLDLSEAYLSVELTSSGGGAVAARFAVGA